MRFLIDENMSNLRLASRLRGQGHDPVLAGDVGLLKMTDPRVLIYSIAQDIPVLTRDAEDFEDLHDLVIAASGHHAGVLIVRFDNDPRHNLTDRGIGTAITKLEASGLPTRNRIHFTKPVAMNVRFAN
jgi:predicted nuclease of predicted toxin-antitoxin system